MVIGEDLKLSVDDLLHAKNRCSVEGSELKNCSPFILAGFVVNNYVHVHGCLPCVISMELRVCQKS
jgi:hypothetical protein